MRHRIRQVIFIITVFAAMILYMPRAVYASDGTISISSTASTTGNEEKSCYATTISSRY